jgi:hypothetical protein
MSNHAATSRRAGTFRIELGLLVCACLLAMACGCGGPGRRSLGLSVGSDGVLQKDGGPYRGIGVN